MRSAAEQEIRDAVVERLRKLRPRARICHEVNVNGQWSNRIDLLAVDEAELIAVELKSEKDTLKRANDQIAAMKLVAHHTILALHECHLVESETNQHAAHYSKLDRKYWMRHIPDDVKIRWDTIAWVYPEYERCPHGYGNVGMWREPERCYERALPHDAINMLWREELLELCGKLRISVGKRPNMTEMIRALRWHANGRELTAGICSALRRRKFAEADDPAQLRAAA